MEYCFHILNCFKCSYCFMVFIKNHQTNFLKIFMVIIAFDKNGVFVTFINPKIFLYYYIILKYNLYND